MSLFDIIGPVMVGPSSSHTAGAARLGLIAGKLLGEPVRRAEITLFESFAATGNGHGTGKAIVGGLLGMQPDDERLPASFELAVKAGLDYQINSSTEHCDHSNTAELTLYSGDHKVNVTGISIGGGSIEITRINGMEVSISADYHTLVVFSIDRFGTVAGIAKRLTEEYINIAFIRLSRQSEGKAVVMVIETDQEISGSLLTDLKNLPNVNDIIYLCPVR